MDVERCEQQRVARTHGCRPQRRGRGEHAVDDARRGEVRERLVQRAHVERCVAARVGQRQPDVALVEAVTEPGVDVRRHRAEAVAWHEDPEVRVRLHQHVLPRQLRQHRAQRRVQRTAQLPCGGFPRQRTGELHGM